MKRQYINPTTDLVKVEMCSMIAGTTEMDVIHSEEITSPEAILSRQGSNAWGDDEE